MDLTISQMLQMQRDLYEQHKNSWFPLEPAYAKDSMLYMVEELGEAIAVVKKKGSDAIVNDPSVRHAFLTEMADVLMYYHDVLLRYGVTAEEMSEALAKKHNYDMQRNYSAEYKEKYNG